MSAAARAQTIQSLRRQLIASQQKQTDLQIIATGLPALDAILPQHGLPTASVIEWMSENCGQSAASLAFRAAVPMMALPGCLAVLDDRHQFQALAAQAQGIPLARLLLIRPTCQVKSSLPSSGSGFRIRQRLSLAENESLWALEQTARCPGVRVIIAWLDRTTSAVMRRLQLAVERSGVTVMLIRPSAVLSQPSFADLRIHVRSDRTDDLNQTRTLVVKVERSRQGLLHEGTAVLRQQPWREQILSG
jgi:hypothetical protein